MFLSHFSNLLHYEMTVISTEIVEYNGYLNVFWFDPQFYVTFLVSGASEFSSDVAMVSNSHIFVCIFITTNVTPIHTSKALFTSCSHNQRFVETFLNNSFAVFNLFKHLFHEFVNGVFTSIRLDWLTIFLFVATYYLISTATVFMSLIGFGV